MTNRQLRTAAAYVFDGRSRLTQAEIARRFGISQSAVSKRLSRFKACLSDEQRSRYTRTAFPGRRRRVAVLQLNSADNV
jgi:predicted transcriptional regulator